MNNEISDTPETDAEWNHLACLEHHEFERQLADFARNLERERDELRWWTAVNGVSELERERDRMQELAEANGTLAHASACEAMDYRRERDEAREKLAEIIEEEKTLRYGLRTLSKTAAEKRIEVADRLDRALAERDEWIAKAVELSAERESNAMQALAYKAERDFLREALSACMEDSIELLSERGWWKDEPRCGYAEQYAQTAENISVAQALLATLQK